MLFGKSGEYFNKHSNGSSEWPQDYYIHQPSRVYKMLFANITVYFSCRKQLTYSKRRRQMRALIEMMAVPIYNIWQPSCVVVFVFLSVNLHFIKTVRDFSV